MSVSTPPPSGPLPPAVPRRLRTLAALLANMRAALLVLVATWAIGLGALAAVVVFQTRLDNQRQAQVVIGTITRQESDLAQLAFSPAVAAQGSIPTYAVIADELRAARNAVRASLATLGALGDRPEQVRLQALNTRYFAAITQVATLVAHGASRAAALSFGRAEQPNGVYGSLLGELGSAGTQDSATAASARRIATAVTTLAILFMLLAFTFSLYRATRLARDKHALLERSRVEALTDTLTGLPNRRSLFADMHTLLSESPAPSDVALGMLDLNGFKQYNDTFGHPAGDALLSRCGHKLAASMSGQSRAYRMGGDEFCVIARGANPERVLEAAAEALSEHGELFDVTCAYGSVLISPGEMTLAQAVQQADQRLYAEKRRTSATNGAGEAYDVLVRVLGENSHSLATHLRNAGRLAEAVAHKLGLSDDDIVLTRLTAELHDVGKTAIPDAILEKPGPLDADEWELMRRHTVIGERILASAPALARVASLVRATHERHDGTGYPDGLRGDEIPLSSRIVAVVDAYDAMTSLRSYRLPLTPEQAIAELRRCAGHQFDADVAAAFLSVWEDLVHPGAGEDAVERSPLATVG